MCRTKREAEASNERLVRCWLVVKIDRLFGLFIYIPDKPTSPKPLR